MAANRRRASALGLGTVGAIAAIKPRPPSSPRSNSLLGDITNGAAGLLSGQKGGADNAEVARLSAKIMDLMNQLHVRDAEHAKLESALEVARKEAANAKALMQSGAPAAASRPQSPQMVASSSRARVPAPRPATSSSPLRKDITMKILSAALREADAMTASKTEELAAARAMIAHRSRGPSPGIAGGDAPAPGVVAKLQAELAEAAEERRNLREQLKVRTRTRRTRGAQYLHRTRASFSPLSHAGACKQRHRIATASPRASCHVPYASAALRACCTACTASSPPRPSLSRRGMHGLKCMRAPSPLPRSSLSLSLSLFFLARTLSRCRRCASGSRARRAT